MKTAFSTDDTVLAKSLNGLAKLQNVVTCEKSKVIDWLAENMLSQNVCKSKEMSVTNKLVNTEFLKVNGNRIEMQKTIVLKKF